MNVIAVAASTTLMNRGSRSMSYDRRIPKSIVSEHLGQIRPNVK